MFRAKSHDSGRVRAIKRPRVSACPCASRACTRKKNRTSGSRKGECERESYSGHHESSGHLDSRGSLVLSGPGVESGTVDAQVRQVDVTPTLLTCSGSTRAAGRSTASRCSGKRTGSGRSEIRRVLEPGLYDLAINGLLENLGYNWSTGVLTGNSDTRPPHHRPRSYHLRELAEQ